MPYATTRPERLIVLDIETTPDRVRMPESQTAKFPKTLYHRIACISFVEAEITVDPGGYERYAITACRSGGEVGWGERRLLEQFWRFFEQRPTRASGWNTRGFDLPVILQRSLLHCVPAKPWFRSESGRDSYRSRYGDTWHADVMDLLADHGACPKLSLDEAAVACELPGKMVAHGSEVEALVAAGRINDVRNYCEIDTLNTYGLYLRYALLSGRTDRAGYDAAIADLADYLDRERAPRPHLGLFLDRWRKIEEQAEVTSPTERQALIDPLGEAA